MSQAATGWNYLRKQFTTTATVTQISVSARADDAPHRIWLDDALLTDSSAVPGSPDINDPITYFYAWGPVCTLAVALPAGAHSLILEYDNKIPTQAWGALDARLTLTTAGVSARAQVVQSCDGTTSLIGIETGQTVPDTAVIVTCPCGCADDGSSGTCGGTQTLALCDTAPAVTVTGFLRHVTHDCAGTVLATTDTELDGITAYTPTGTIDICQTPAEGRGAELTPMCVVDNATGGIMDLRRSPLRHRHR